MPGRASWSPAFVGLEPVTMAAEDYNGVLYPVTSGVADVDRQGGMAPHSLERGGYSGKSVVCDRRDQCLAMGELQHAAELLEGGI